MKAIVATCLAVLLHCAMETCAMSSDLLLREFNEIRELEHQSQKEKRVARVIELMITPLERHDLFYERTEGQKCDAGNGKQATATCNGDVTCSEEGVKECRAICDAPLHGDLVFECKCESGYTGLLCDTTTAERDANCKKCTGKNGVCIHGSNYKDGYECYAKDYSKIININKKSMESSESSEEGEEGDEDLALVARMIQAFVNSKL